MQDEVRRIIGLRLKEARKACKLAQSEVATELSVARQTVSGWECGRALPKSEEWYKLAPLYGESLDYLVYGLRMDADTSPMLKQIFRPREAEEPARSG